MQVWVLLLFTIHRQLVQSTINLSQVPQPEQRFSVNEANSYYQQEDFEIIYVPQEPNISKQDAVPVQSNQDSATLAKLEDIEIIYVPQENDSNAEPLVATSLIIQQLNDSVTPEGEISQTLNTIQEDLPKQEPGTEAIELDILSEAALQTNEQYQQIMMSEVEMQSLEQTIQNDTQDVQETAKHNSIPSQEAAFFQQEANMEVNLIEDIAVALSYTDSNEEPLREMSNQILLEIPFIEDDTDMFEEIVLGEQDYRNEPSFESVGIMDDFLDLEIIESQLQQIEPAQEQQSTTPVQTVSFIDTPLLERDQVMDDILDLEVIMTQSLQIEPVPEKRYIAPMQTVHVIDAQLTPLVEVNEVMGDFLDEEIIVPRFEQNGPVSEQKSTTPIQTVSFIYTVLSPVEEPMSEEKDTMFQHSMQDLTPSSENDATEVIYTAENLGYRDIPTVEAIAAYKQIPSPNPQVENAQFPGSAPLLESIEEDLDIIYTPSEQASIEDVPTPEAVMQVSNASVMPEPQLETIEEYLDIVYVSSEQTNLEDVPAPESVMPVLSASKMPVPQLEIADEDLDVIQVSSEQVLSEDVAKPQVEPQVEIFEEDLDIIYVPFEQMLIEDVPKSEIAEPRTPKTSEPQLEIVEEDLDIIYVPSAQAPIENIPKPEAEMHVSSMAKTLEPQSEIIEEDFDIISVSTEQVPTEDIPKSEAEMQKRTVSKALMSVEPSTELSLGSVSAQDDDKISIMQFTQSDNQVYEDIDAFDLEEHTIENIATVDILRLGLRQSLAQDISRFTEPMPQTERSNESEQTLLQDEDIEVILAPQSSILVDKVRQITPENETQLGEEVFTPTPEQVASFFNILPQDEITTAVLQLSSGVQEFDLEEEYADVVSNRSVIVSSVVDLDAFQSNVAMMGTGTDLSVEDEPTTEFELYDLYEEDNIVTMAEAVNVTFDSQLLSNLSKSPIILSQRVVYEIPPEPEQEIQQLLLVSEFLDEDEMRNDISDQQQQRILNEAEQASILSQRSGLESSPEPEVETQQALLVPSLQNLDEATVQKSINLLPTPEITPFTESEFPINQTAIQQPQQVTQPPASEPFSELLQNISVLQIVAPNPETFEEQLAEFSTLRFTYNQDGQSSAENIQALFFPQDFAELRDAQQTATTTLGTYTQALQVTSAATNVGLDNFSTYPEDSGIPQDQSIYQISDVEYEKLQNNLQPLEEIIPKDDYQPIFSSPQSQSPVTSPIILYQSPPPTPMGGYYDVGIQVPNTYIVDIQVPNTYIADSSQSPPSSFLYVSTPSMLQQYPPPTPFDGYYFIGKKVSDLDDGDQPSSPVVLEKEGQQDTQQASPAVPVVLTEGVRQRWYYNLGASEFIDTDSICDVSRAGCSCLPMWTYDADKDGKKSLFRGCIQTKDARGRAWCPVDPSTCREGALPASEGLSPKQRTETPWDFCPKTCTLTRRGICNKTVSGCTCRLRWTYEGLLQQGCTRPDGTPDFSWCVVRTNCTTPLGNLSASHDNLEWDICPQNCN
eukprot:TRINITY_DN709_c0_g1_i2.p1 TRINITY_DN709_c0_g1~~TRINITY_DN709_c0_g1_i2.p1  ORF type:complete len:1511 (+),score=187.72 TRINITY_DN709_c0_g1_i2:634-5166(+)